MDPAKILQEGCLFQFQSGCWRASKMLHPRVVERIGNPEWVKGKKHLVDSGFLTPPTQVIDETRKRVSLLSTPFQVTGLCMIGKRLILEVDDFMKQQEDKFWGCVDQKIIPNYAEAREMAREVLEKDGLFNELDYPEDLRSTYRFSWRFVELGVPGQLRGISAELYRKELNQFQDLLKEAKGLAIGALYTEIDGLVGHMVDRLGRDDDDKPKKFKDSLVTNFDQFFSTFEDREFYGDERLREIVATCRETLRDVSPGQLREYSDFRGDIRTKMMEIKSAISEAVEDLPMRKLKLAKAA